MNVMVYLGKATPRVVNGLKSMSDDIDFATYTSVESFVQEAEIRHLSFSRLVFNNKFVSGGEADYVRLNEFIREFSNATELVMVINNGDTVSEALFNKYFSSPMYTCAIVRGATSMDFFRDVVSGSIVDVKARYYTLEKGSEPQAAPKPFVGDKPSNSPGSKKAPEVDETTVPQSNTSEGMPNGGVFVNNTDSNSGGKNAGQVASDMGSFSSNVECRDAEPAEGSSFSSEGLPPLELPSYTPEDFVPEDEDDLLAVGSFGSVHSDTGMFDEEDDGTSIPEGSAVDEEAARQRRELEEQARRAQQPPKKVVTGHRTDKDSSDRKPTAKREWSILSNSPYVPYKLNFVVSANGGVSAQQIADDSVRMMEAGMRVLIVDMDFYSNGILSFIDTARYYQKNHNGYTDGKVFVEEGIGVVSGGYGFIPSKEELDNILGKCASAFDIVLVDCPLAFIKFISLQMLKEGNPIVLSGNDPSQIVSTALAITDRDNCTLQQERVLMRSTNYVLVGGNNELVEKTLSGMFFPNGCWLR